MSKFFRLFYHLKNKLCKLKVKSSALFLYQLSVLLQFQALSRVGGSCCLMISVSKKKKKDSLNCWCPLLISFNDICRCCVLWAALSSCTLNAACNQGSDYKAWNFFPCAPRPAVKPSGPVQRSLRGRSPLGCVRWESSSQPGVGSSLPLSFSLS